MVRRVGFFLLASVALVGALEATGPGENEADSVEAIKQEVLRVEEERSQAMLKGDADALGRICADEFAWMSPRGELLTKAEILENLRSHKQEYVSTNRDDIRLHVHGNTVVMTVHSLSTARYEGKTFNYPRRFSNVYVKRNGQWQLVLHQATRIANP
jgi:ketosteroid isomerase-like protein